MRSLRKHMAQCVVCGEPPYRNLGLVGPTCRSCLTKAVESDDYVAWYEERM